MPCDILARSLRTASCKSHGAHGGLREKNVRGEEKLATIMSAVQVVVCQEILFVATFLCLALGQVLLLSNVSRY